MDDINESKEKEKKDAIRKAMNVLLSNDKSEKELRDRLSKAGFSDEAIDSAIDYCKGFGYVDDRRIAENFILSQSSKKSRREIEMKLFSKGIDRDLIDEVFASIEDDESADLYATQLEAAKKIFKKKIGQGLDPESFNDAMKIKAALYNKGFSEEIIRELMD